VNHEHNFFAKHWFVIGIFALIIVGIFAVAFTASNMTRGLYSSNSEEYEASIEDRIRPIGHIYRPGEEVYAGDPQVVEAAPPEPVATVMSGPQVYNAACIVCHGSGIGGAPSTGDDAAWQPRIAQGDITLYLHAIEGYTGLTGFMPQKGGRLDLSDDEVRGAVDYMVSELRE